MTQLVTIIKDLLQIEDDANNVINQATKEAESIRSNAVLKIEKYQKEKNEECVKETNTILNSARNEAKEQIKKIEQSTEWELKNLTERFNKKKETFIELIINKIKPAI